MKLHNKKTGETRVFCYLHPTLPNGSVLLGLLDDDGETQTYTYGSLAELNEEWEDYKPAEPLIKDEKIRKAVRAWADVLEIDEVEFYGSETWIGFRAKNTGTGWSSKFELDYFGSENTLVPFRTYTIAELCGEEEE